MAAHLRDYFMLTALAALLIHEADAVRCKEWRMLPGLDSLSDRFGRLAFQYLHFPLYLALLYYALLAPSAGFDIGFGVFGMLHLVAHLFFLRHPANRFLEVQSWLWIVAFAGSGAALISLRLW